VPVFEIQFPCEQVEALASRFSYANDEVPPITVFSSDLITEIPHPG